MPDDIRDLWQQQELERVIFTLEEIRRKAGSFQRSIHWRNVREYAVAGGLIAFFAWGAWQNPGPQRVPDLLLMAGLGYVLYQLHSRGAGSTRNSWQGWPVRCPSFWASGR
jgi:hypothetical protein